MFILIRQLPDADDRPGPIKAHNNAFTTENRAAQAAARLLRHNTSMPKAAVGKVINALTVGAIWDHESGYRFRILEAHYTDDKVLITPGLRVFCYYDSEWGTVEETQFFNDAMLAPGSKHFDGWYLIRTVDGDGFCKKFNGARLATREVHQ